MGCEEGKGGKREERREERLKTEVERGGRDRGREEIKIENGMWIRYECDIRERREKEI